MVKLDDIRPRVYVYKTAGPGALAWLRSCWERVFFGHKSLFGNASRGQKRGTLGLYFVKNARLSAAKAVLFSSSSPQIAHFCCLALDSRTSSKQYELEDLGERGLAFRCTLDQRFFGPTPQQEEKALAAFKQAWEILRAGWAKVLGNLSAQEREAAPRYFDFLQLKTILPIYAPDGRYIEAWQALYELSLPLAPAQDSLSRPPRVLLEGEYLSLELRGNYLAKAVFAHLPVQARRGSDLFAERFTQPTAMLFKRVNGRFLAPFFMGENGASPACKEAVGVDSIGLMRAKSALPEPTACTKMIVVEPQTLKHPSQEEPKGSAVIQINAEYRLVTRSEGNVYYYPKFIPSIFSGSMRKGDCKLFMSQLPSSNRRPTILDEEPKADNVPYYEVQINFIELAARNN